jgi:hypothetical protein
MAREPSPSSPSAAPGRLQTALLRLGVVGELIAHFARGDRWWLAPLALVLGLLGLVMVVLQSIEYVAPFVYLTF